MRKMSIPVIVLLTMVMVGVGIAGAQALKPGNVLVRDLPFDKSGILLDSRVDNTPPVVSNVGTTGASGVIDVTYDLTDTEGDLCSILVEYMGGSVGTTWVSASTTGSLEGLKPGSGLTIEWNSHIDEPGIIADNYQIRITPSDAEVGLPGTSSEFYVNNIGANFPPVVSNVGTAGASGVIGVTYDLTDTNGDLCSILVEYRGGSVGATWVSASTTGSLEGLIPGAGLTIEWNSHLDEPGIIASDYQIRITPSDTEVGTPGISTEFYVNNNVPPVVSDVGTTGASGVIDVTYDLTDTEGDLCSIVVEFIGGNAGSTWVSASTTGSLEFLTPGIGLTIEWNSHLDEPGIIASDYQIRITPSDAEMGTPGISPFFYVSNNGLPVVSSVGTTGASGVIDVTYDLTDSEGNICNIGVEYRGGSVGETWTAASVSGDYVIVSPNIGIHTLYWHSGDDEAGYEADDYELRLTPNDFQVGVAGYSALFSVDNNGGGAIGPEERAVLITIYDATGGSDWTDDINWLAEPGTECDWYGVTCDALGLTVTKLLLDSNALRGHIPPDIGSLLNLEIFDIAANQVGGSIPLEIGGLSSLRVLTLRDNELGGSIPSELGNLTNLQSLDLSQNRLSGSIPPELGGYSAIQYLRLYRNQLGGSVPPELTNLVTLFSLELFDNALWTDDLDLAAFLGLFDPDWDQTQTIAPQDVAVTITSNTWVWIEWTPIDYTYGDGGYAIFPEPSPSAISIFDDGFESGDSDWWGIGNPWVETTDKTADSIMVDGLTPNTSYTFTVRTITEPHLNNKNQVISEASITVSATTSP